MSFQKFFLLSQSLTLFSLCHFLFLRKKKRVFWNSLIFYLSISLPDKERERGKETEIEKKRGRDKRLNNSLKFSLSLSLCLFLSLSMEERIRGSERQTERQSFQKFIILLFLSLSFSLPFISKNKKTGEKKTWIRKEKRKYFCRKTTVILV